MLIKMKAWPPFQNLGNQKSNVLSIACQIPDFKQSDVVRIHHKSLSYLIAINLHLWKPLVTIWAFLTGDAPSLPALSQDVKGRDQTPWTASSYRVPQLLISSQPRDKPCWFGAVRSNESALKFGTKCWILFLTYNEFESRTSLFSPLMTMTYF